MKDVNIGQYNFSEVEKSILSFWNEQEIYRTAKEKNKGKQKFYFLDGPPYTSGKVHVGTAWNKALKDSILRYKRMRGFDVWDRAGYDMHGLPTENATQKKLGLKTKDEIENYGVPSFIEECKKLCIENMEYMNDDFRDLGVWMDFKDAYQTIRREYMTGEWWLIKKAHEKGRLYQGLRTMTWCPITESALAKHELEYRTVTDDSIFVRMKKKGTENEYFIIWTTTPWTIPFNLAIMVNPDLDYVKCKVTVEDGKEEYWYVAKALSAAFIGMVAGYPYEIVDEFKGDVLEGMEYIHPFYDELKTEYDPIKEESPKAHTILLSTDYVDVSAGTGLVHCAPGCGPEDYEIGYQNGIPAYNTIDTKGRFPEQMGRFDGLVAKKNDNEFIEALRENKTLVASTPVEHEYAHDWRYHNPVIFRTTKQWFFKVEDLKEEIIAKNDTINWVPQSAYNAFDSWLKNLRDNSISKQRYWGTPIPIWVNVEDETDYIVIGSAEELEELSGQKVDDLHIPTVDPIEIKKDNKTYRRIPDVLDVWVDAGAASWNCLDYPQKEEHFKELFPADFILEGKDQIRGWFNLLHIASMISMGVPSFKNVYMHGFIQDAQGRKMSKSQGNYILPSEVIKKYGADTMRYYMIGGANPAEDLNYNFDDVEVKNKNLLILWNLQKYIVDLAKTAGVNPATLTKDDVLDSFDIEERYMLSRCNSIVKELTNQLDSYQLNMTPWLGEELYLELSRTYIKFIRDKSVTGTDNEKRAVLYVIYTSFMTALKVLAPVIPFITEKVYQNMKEAFSDEAENAFNTSIHLESWPSADEQIIDTPLEESMVYVKDTIQAILYMREKANAGVRWPLGEVIIKSSDEKLAQAITDFEGLIKNQTNIRSITLTHEFDKLEEIVKPNHKEIGPEFGEAMPKIVARLGIESASMILDHIRTRGKYDLEIDGEVYPITKRHIIVEKKLPPEYVSVDYRYGDIFLDTTQDEDMIAEGFARELVRRIQVIRKNLGLFKADKITLTLKAPAEHIEPVKQYLTPSAERIGATNIAVVSELGEDVIDSADVHKTEKIRGETFELCVKQQ